MTGIWEGLQNANAAMLLSTGGMPHAVENFFEFARNKETQ
jgi:hypothetical protein